jgi:ribosome-associated protein
MGISLKETVRLAIQAAEDKKAEEIAALDLRGLSAVTDFFIVTHGSSDTHVRAIAEGIEDALSQKGIEPYGREGYNEGRWVLLDYVDLVIHVFHREQRAFYALEQLWSDAPRVRAADLAEGAKKKKK